MSTSLAAKLGSRECLKLRSRCGCSLCARQMRCTEPSEIPMACHRPAAPMGRLMRRLAAGQRHHPRRGFRGNRRLAGLAGLFAKQTFNPALGKALLPAPHGRPADADTLRHPLR